MKTPKRSIANIVLTEENKKTFFMTMPNKTNGRINEKVVL